MSKDFWKDKHLYDRYNKRGPGQENDPNKVREKVSPPSPQPAAPEKEPTEPPRKD